MDLSTRIGGLVSTAPHHVIWAIAITPLVVYIGVLCYNLFLHPLAGFPGPRAAALSQNWSYGLAKRGHAEAELEELHRLYNTDALRVAPNELHITDVSLYKRIYSQTKPFPKDEAFYSSFNIPHSVFTETDAALHKIRRGMFSPFFSKTAIDKLQQHIADHVEKLRYRLEAHSDLGLPVPAHRAFRCLTADIISDYAFANSLNLVQASDYDFHAPFLEAFEAVTACFWDARFNPVMRKIGSRIPRWLTEILNKDVAKILRLRDFGEESWQRYMSTEERDKTTIFDGLNTLPPDQMVTEAVDVLVAGSDTTAFSLSMAIWHISRNPDIKRRLVQALVQAIPDGEPRGTLPPLLQLELIPMLQACVREAFRLAMAVPGRLPRIVPNDLSEPLVVGNKVVPPGTVVGMSTYTMHRSQKIWGPDALAFVPDRWLADGAKELASQLVTFSKGARSCLGQNLAFAETTLVLAMLYRYFDIDLSAPQVEVFDLKDNFTNEFHGSCVQFKLTRK